MDHLYEEVDYAKYCKTCEYIHKMEEEEPCDECLTEPVNKYSQKPVRWKEKIK